MATDHFRDTETGAIFAAEKPKRQIAVSGKWSEDKRRGEGERTDYQHGCKKKQADFGKETGLREKYGRRADYSLGI
jgi:hypothetical protein